MFPVRQAVVIPGQAIAPACMIEATHQFYGVRWAAAGEGTHLGGGAHLGEGTHLGAGGQTDTDSREAHRRQQPQRHACYLGP